MSDTSFRSATLGIRLVAIAAILVLSGINYLGVKQGSTLQTIFTLGKVIAIVAILVLVVVLRSPGAAGTSASYQRTNLCGQVRAGGRRRPLRVRRLAHGDLHG